MELKLENMSKMSEEELHIAIEGALDHAREASPIDRLAMLQEAQFYTRELERRDDSWTARRDFWLEIIVIGLIAMELILGIYQERAQSKSADEQQKVLTNLQQSSQATAATLAALRTTTEAMNKGIQGQLELNFEVILKSDLDTENRSLDIKNNSKTTLYWWGSQDEYGKKIIFKSPTELHSGEQINLDLGPYYKIAPDLFRDGQISVIAALFFKNQRGEEFVGRFILMGNKRTGFVGQSDIQIAAESWSSASFKVLQSR